MHIHYSKPISSHKYKYIFIYICLIYILFSVLNKATQNSIKIVISIKKKIFGMSLVIQWLSKTPHFYYRGRGFDLWSGNQDPTRHTTRPKKKKKKNQGKETICHFSALHLEASFGSRDMRQNLRNCDLLSLEQ